MHKVDNPCLIAFLIGIPIFECMWFSVAPEMKTTSGFTGNNNHFKPIYLTFNSTNGENQPLIIDELVEYEKLPVEV